MYPSATGNPYYGGTAPPATSAFPYQTDPNANPPAMNPAMNQIPTPQHQQMYQQGMQPPYGAQQPFPMQQQPCMQPQMMNNNMVPQHQGVQQHQAQQQQQPLPMTMHINVGGQQQMPQPQVNVVHQQHRGSSGIVTTEDPQKACRAYQARVRAFKDMVDLMNLRIRYAKERGQCSARIQPESDLQSYRNLCGELELEDHEIEAFVQNREKCKRDVVAYFLRHGYEVTEKQIGPPNRFLWTVDASWGAPKKCCFCD
ncbi:unnamed protein product [Amoebophrya sp. A120]|nr:unnamed protein product [Amoebophrya sp. A120]|eukprot:GSA120T00017713001.1